MLGRIRQTTTISDNVSLYYKIIHSKQRFGPIKLTPPLRLIKVSVTNQESGWSRICALDISVLPLSTIFRLDLELFRYCRIIFREILCSINCILSKENIKQCIKTMLWSFNEHLIFQPNYASIGIVLAW